MRRSTFEQLRIPAAIVLIAIAAFVLWPRDRGADPLAAPTATPGMSVIVGEPGGVVFPASAEPSATPIPTLSAPPTPQPTPTPAPTAAPTAAPVADGFTAEVLVCRSISGSTCNDPLTTVPPSLASFTVLVRFTDAIGGDVIEVILRGPHGTTSSGGYTLQGGGDGYYYATFQAGNLPGGDYTVTATRNGGEVASTAFRKAGR